MLEKYRKIMPNLEKNFNSAKISIIGDGDIEVKYERLIIVLTNFQKTDFNNHDETTIDWEVKFINKTLTQEKLTKIIGSCKIEELMTVIKYVWFSLVLKNKTTNGHDYPNIDTEDIQRLETKNFEIKIYF